MMVVAEQVQHAVDDHVRPVGDRRLALLGGLALDHRGADDQIAEQRADRPGSASMPGGSRTGNDSTLVGPGDRGSAG
jgi:hypothetical protein